MKSASIIKNFRANKEEVNHHFVFIEAPAELVSPEIILWGEASWWPKQSTMKFTRTTPGAAQVGTRYEQKVLLPGAPHWSVEVTKLVPGRDAEIERTFLNGIFSGKENIVLESSSNGTRIDYIMSFKIRGFFNRLVWKLFFKRLHDRNIDMILTALKEYVLREQKRRKVR